MNVLSVSNSVTGIASKNLRWKGNCQFLFAEASELADAPRLVGLSHLDPDRRGQRAADDFAERSHPFIARNFTPRPRTSRVDIVVNSIERRASGFYKQRS